MGRVFPNFSKGGGFSKILSHIVTHWDRHTESGVGVGVAVKVETGILQNEISVTPHFPSGTELAKVAVTVQVFERQRVLVNVVQSRVNVWVDLHIQCVKQCNNGMNQTWPKGGQPKPPCHRKNWQNPPLSGSKH